MNIAPPWFVAVLLIKVQSIMSTLPPETTLMAPPFVELPPIKVMFIKTIWVSPITLKIAALLRAFMVDPLPSIVKFFLMSIPVAKSPDSYENSPFR